MHQPLTTALKAFHAGKTSRTQITQHFEESRDRFEEFYRQVMDLPWDLADPQQGEAHELVTMVLNSIEQSYAGIRVYLEEGDLEVAKRALKRMAKSQETLLGIPDYGPQVSLQSCLSTWSGL